MPGAPAGIGVRETMMVMFLGDIVSSDILLLSAVVFRIICIVGDVMAFVLIQLFSSLVRRH
jgi:uncharacterized membrane protein YbhN (UPF0104 family)